MKLHLATAHGPSASYQAAGNARTGTSSTPIWPAIQRLGKRLLDAMRPTNLDEAYLAQAQNHADLERRMQNLLGPQRDQSYWRY